MPKGKRAIGCKWLYETKYRSDGSIDRHKARLVIQGCRQQKGIDCEETFAPIAKMTTVRAVLAIATMKDWNVYQMDVTNAFLHGDLEEEVYMQLPKGYVKKGELIQCNTQAVRTKYLPGSTVCKLRKSLYGLKQAPRQWFAKLSSSLLSFGFIQSKADYSLFTKQTKQGFTVVLVYVDDMLITGSHPLLIQQLKQHLQHSFHFRSRKRVMEIALSTERKLPFVHGTLPRPTDDPIKGDQWDACNNLVISWIMNTVSDSIADSILHIESDAEIWK